MKGLGLVLFTAVLLASAACAEPVFVYSEFARIDTKTGDVIAPESPREILSPAVVRNGFTSFQVVVQAPAEDKWWLFIGQNPENAFKVTMYRESSEGLERVDLPIESQGTQVYWMDVWTAGDAPVRRVKLEPELNLHDDWIIYPMEARVVDANVPEGRVQAVGTAVAAMRGFLCGNALPDSMAAEGLSIPSFRLRNARQDLALAAAAPKDDLKNLFGDCAAPASPDPEWYLKIRDYLFRLR
jgi:hypothetical protein